MCQNATFYEQCPHLHIPSPKSNYFLNKRNETRTDFGQSNLALSNVRALRATRTMPAGHRAPLGHCVWPNLTLAYLESRKRMWDHPEWRSGSVRRKDQVDFRCLSGQCSKDCDHFPGEHINENYRKITSSPRAKTYKNFQNPSRNVSHLTGPISSISHSYHYRYVDYTSKNGSRMRHADHRKCGYAATTVFANLEPFSWYQIPPNWCWHAGTKKCCEKKKRHCAPVSVWTAAGELATRRGGCAQTSSCRW